MTATIIQSNSTPFERVEVDTVTVDIIENALRNVREEMDAVLFRTAMSPGIREQGDCFPMVANREGKMVVGQFGSFIHGFMDAYDDSIEEGDVILTNDPKFTTMCEEIFGPVLTVYTYAAEDWDETVRLVDTTSPYALTGAVFANDRSAVRDALAGLRDAAGNFYINDML